MERDFVTPCLLQPNIRTEAEVRAARAPLSMLDVIQRGAIRAEPRPCPFCGTVPTQMARQCGPTFLVGCDEDECFDSGVVAQASGKTVEAAWAAWNRRPAQLSIVSTNTDEELAGGGNGRL